MRNRSAPALSTSSRSTVGLPTMSITAALKSAPRSGGASPSLQPTTNTISRPKPGRSMPHILHQPRSGDLHSTRDVDLLAGHVIRERRGEEQHRVGDVLGLAETA